MGVVSIGSERERRLFPMTSIISLSLWNHWQIEALLYVGIGIEGGLLTRGAEPL